MKNNSEGLALENINNYYKAIAIKTVWHSFKDRLLAQN